MALSGKTINYKLKYPAVSDNIVMGPGANDNDFKEMMVSVDTALYSRAFKQVEQGTDLNTVVAGLYQLTMPMVNDPSPTMGVRYLITTSGPPGRAQYYFADNGKIYYRFNNQEWKEITTEAELERLNYYGDKDIIPSSESYFTVNDTGETITGLTDTGKTQTELVIPYKINGKKITTLYSGVTGHPPVSILNGSSTITKVVIPKSVTTLGRGAFYDCSHLIDINIPDSVTSIEEYAFSMCTALTSINIPNSVTSIYDDAFGSCSSLTSINIPDSITSIGRSTFANCSSLKSINIPNSVTSIGPTAFVSCSNLTIYCEQDSYAETFAKSKNIPIVYTAVSDIGSGKKYSTIVIGNSASGITANDVDYLYEAGSDFGSVLSSAISKLTGSGAKGGEIKILSGTYTLTSAVTTSGTSTAPIKITGEGQSTIITSTTPESYYINASYCEISECKLDTEIRITTNGYVNIHDCEIAEGIIINNTSAIYDIFIHDNNLNIPIPTAPTERTDFLHLSGSGGIYNFQVYNNYCYRTMPFKFLYATATKSIYSSSIRNNNCSLGTWDSSTYDLNGFKHNQGTMTGNTFHAIDFKGDFWCISNNHIVTDLYLYDGDYLDVMNNRVDGIFTVASGLTYANITGNTVDSVDNVNLGTDTRFVNNTIRNTNFSITRLPGHDTVTNKWGNNMWADGIDRLVFANGEGIGEGQGDA